MSKTIEELKSDYAEIKRQAAQDVRDLNEGREAKQGRCFPFFHQWGRWKVLQSHSWGSYQWRLTQERACECCGKTQVSDKIRSA